jgi:flagellar hook protein FlgE
VYASGAVNLNTSTAGEGVRLVTAAQQFTQGNITTTGSNAGYGDQRQRLLHAEQPQRHVYTRNGQFSEDKNGNVVSAPAGFLQVYPPLANGGFNTGALTDSQSQTAQSAPVATTTGTVILNLPSNSTVPTAGARSIRPIQHLQPVDLDHGVRLARQFLSGHVLFHADRDARQWTVNMTVNGTRSARPDR